ncbi:MAG: hypothetical protein Q8T03_14445 [Bacteroidota bacterium]|nr:hypothetical protein [Bacteroidota bacterium]
MKKIILLYLFAITFSLTAQYSKAPTMAPILTNGYYINFRGDTIKGQVQINPPNKTDFYKQFGFQKKNTRKAKLMLAQKTKAYGFDNRHFVMINYDDKKIFVERLATGRLNFYEYRFNDNTNKDIESESYFFIEDSGENNSDKGTQSPKKITHKFYKKNLKPFMKEQPQIWNELDKFNFDEKSVISAVNEYNKNYTTTSY